MNRRCSANYELRDCRKSALPAALRLLCPRPTLIDWSAKGCQKKATFDFGHEKRHLARTLE
jgi:hypothetical protein